MLGSIIERGFSANSDARAVVLARSLARVSREYLAPRSHDRVGVIHRHGHLPEPGDDEVERRLVLLQGDIAGGIHARQIGLHAVVDLDVAPSDRLQSPLAYRTEGGFEAPSPG